MKAKLENIYHLFLYTCVFNSYSIVMGGLMTFFVMLGLCLFIDGILPSVISPIIVIGFYMGMVRLHGKLPKLFTFINTKSCLLGIIIGGLWVALIA